VVTTATGTTVTQTFTKVRTETVVVATTVKQNVVVTTTVYVPVPGGAYTALSGVAIARPFDAFIFIRGER
jgi:tagatose-1,6-bisphosphate aldolase non-catalytic subunit AgaZ/GatZ